MKDYPFLQLAMYFSTQNTLGKITLQKTYLKKTYSIVYRKINRKGFSFIGITAKPLLLTILDYTQTLIPEKVK